MSLLGDASFNLFADAKGQGCAIVHGDAHSAALEMTCNKEKFQSKSSYDSELTNQNKLCMIGKWWYLIFKECGIIVELPIEMFCDNEAVVTTNNQEHILKGGSSKFMTRNLFQLFHEVKQGLISSKWISTHNNGADIGTKNLQGRKFTEFARRTFSRLLMVIMEKSDDKVEEMLI